MGCFATLSLFAQMRGTPNPNVAVPAIPTAFLAVQLAITLLTIVATVAGMWAVFAKAGEPGWAAIVPIYNLVVLLRIGGLPGWYVLLMFIPCIGGIIGLIVMIMATINLASRFNVGGGFVAGLILLPFIFYPILGFGSYECDGRSDRPKKRKRRKVKRAPVDDEDDLEPAPSKQPADNYDDDGNDEPADEPPPVRRSPAPRPTSVTRFNCPTCAAALRLPPDLPPGKRIRCPKCQKVFSVPE
jgi:hypothetical protein